MKLIYATNIWSHHQIPVATALAELLGSENFKMVIFEEVHEERRKMGWAESVDLPWVIGPPRDKMEMQSLIKECIDADVMVIGACPWAVYEARIATQKLTLIASERILKKPFHRLRMLNPRYARGIRRYCRLVNQPHVHSLAIGHYAPDDLRTIGAFGNQIWQWAYFIDTSTTLSEMPPDRPLKLLWVGRMLKWKRVDLLLRALDRLRNSGDIDECLIVGDGPERQNLLTLARQLHLSEDYVRFQHSVPSLEVRHLMRNADAYVLTSSRHEGWGAVAGEAMVEGCVLVANEKAGAARELIVNGETGFLFNDGDYNQLASCIEFLSHNYEKRMEIRQLALQSMQNVWSPSVGAKRLVKLIDCLLVNRSPGFIDGPCSPVDHC